MEFHIPLVRYGSKYNNIGFAIRCLLHSISLLSPTNFTWTKHTRNGNYDKLISAKLLMCVRVAAMHPPSTQSSHLATNNVWSAFDSADHRMKYDVLRDYCYVRPSPQTPSTSSFRFLLFLFPSLFSPSPPFHLHNATDASLFLPIQLLKEAHSVTKNRY